MLGCRACIARCLLLRHHQCHGNVFRGGGANVIRCVNRNGSLSPSLLRVGGAERVATTARRYTQYISAEAQGDRHGEVFAQSLSGDAKTNARSRRDPPTRPSRTKMAQSPRRTSSPRERRTDDTAMTRSRHKPRELRRKLGSDQNPRLQAHKTSYGRSERKPPRAPSEHSRAEAQSWKSSGRRKMEAQKRQDAPRISSSRYRGQMSSDGVVADGRRRALEPSLHHQDSPSAYVGAKDRHQKSSRRNEPRMYKAQDIEKELVYLKDPLKLADHVHSLLDGGFHHKAFDLVRSASKDVSCTVSWNHLVNYNMSIGSVSLAMKQYNEMKKRAQMPDARTYTLIFRGLARHASHPTTVQRALSVYHSMFATGAPVKPTIIHTNAVLQVFSHSKDMDALWGVAAKMPTRGKNAPDQRTYTIMLNAIKESIVDAEDQEKINRSDRGRKEAVRQALVLSHDIINGWRKGDLSLDEELVCAMGRVLLQGPLEDVNHVLGLVEQTTGLKRPPVDAAGGEKATEEAQKQISRKPSRSSAVLEPKKDGEPMEDLDNALSSSASPAIVFPVPGKPASTGFVKPGNNILSMILEACRVLEKPEAAKMYYELLTGPAYMVEPDSVSCHEYLRCLRFKRDSEQVLKIVLEMQDRSKIAAGGRNQSSPRSKPGLLAEKTFRIAMSTCRRAGSMAAYHHAQRIVQIMLGHQKIVSYHVLRDFLSIVLNSPATRKNWRASQQAEDLVYEAFNNLRSSVAYTEVANHASQMQEAAEIAQMMLALYSRILTLGKEELPDVLQLRRRKTTIDLWLRRLEERGRVKKRSGTRLRQQGPQDDEEGGTNISDEQVQDPGHHKGRKDAQTRSVYDATARSHQPHRLGPDNGRDGDHVASTEASTYKRLDKHGDKKESKARPDPDLDSLVPYDNKTERRRDRRGSTMQTGIS